MNIRHQGIGMTSRRTRDRMIARLTSQGICNDLVLDAMSDIPRHIFVEEALASRAYEDNSLPIGFNQTISKPYTVARMTELLLQNGRLEKVLEVGTGSGYQTALLAQLVHRVFSVERLRHLQQRAQKCLQELQLYNISFKHSDGGWGWTNHAPYDGILVTAAPSQIPDSLLDQLAIGGVMVIPVGRDKQQELQKVIRTDRGYEIEIVERASFVPLVAGSR